MSNFSAFNREDQFENMQEEALDLLVIGGGITGAGISLDAASRGLNVAVVDQQDFGAGTSSRSTKLVHGGLRYLQQLQMKIVAEVGKERAIVYENGPHITTPEWMMLPFYKGGTFGPFTSNIGLRVYDLLAGVKKGERRKMLSPDQANEKEPLIQRDGLKGAGYYVEYKTDDARLTMEVLKKAAEHGTHAMNYAEVVNFKYDNNGTVCGVSIKDNISGQIYDVYAKKIVSASGIWVEALSEKDGEELGKNLILTKGVHLVFSKAVFPLEQAIYFDSPDKRMIFAIPRGDKTYVGTTDTFYEGDYANPVPTAEDRDYLIKTVNHMFPSLNIDTDDVESSWAGVRALFSEGSKDKPGEVSREDEIFISDSGLISIAGGKLTGYRKMAEDTVDTVVKQLKHEEEIIYSESVTKDLPVSGGEVGGSKGFEQFKKQKLEEAMKLGIPENFAQKVIEMYGRNAEKLFDIYLEHQTQAEETGMDPFVLTQLIYSMKYEFTYKPVDFFIRRTGALFFDISWVKKHQQSVVDYMSQMLEWTEVQKTAYENELESAIKDAEIRETKTKAND